MIVTVRSNLADRRGSDPLMISAWIQRMVALAWRVPRRPADPPGPPGEFRSSPRSRSISGHTPGHTFGVTFQAAILAAIALRAGPVVAHTRRFASPDAFHKTPTAPGAAHDLLTISYWAGATLAGVVRFAFEPYDTGDTAKPWTIDWRERGGPPVTSPLRRGFGSRLLDQAVAHELSGETILTFPPGGAACRLLFPLSSKVTLQ